MPPESDTDQDPILNTAQCDVPQNFFEKCLLHHIKNTIPIAEKIRREAKKVNDAEWVYGLFGALDGLSTSFSMLKYFFDAYYANSSLSSADMLHDWSLSSEGIAFMTLESAVLIAWGLIGNMGKPDKGTIRKDIADAWPYFRHVMKAMKNTNKGVRNAYLLADLMSIGPDARYWVMPVGMVLGVLAARNRTWLHAARDRRKKLQTANDKLLKRLLGKETPESISIEQFELTQNDPPEWLWISHSTWLYISGTFSGIVDAPYLYFGVMSLTLLTPGTPLFLLVVGSSLLFAAMCVIIRVFEEHDYQRKQRISQLEVKLAISLREYFDFLETQIDLNQEGAINDLQLKLQTLKELHTKWRDETQLTWAYRLLCGLKNGLDAYGSLASIMFAMASIAQLLCIPYSPLLLAGFIIAGMTGILFFSALALIMPAPHPELTLPNAFTKKEAMMLCLSALENTTKPINVIELSAENTPTPHYFFQDWFEILRLFGSGIGKGIRSVDSIMVAWQTLGEDGHYHDTNSMFIFAWFSAIIYAVIFTLRGFARLGRDFDDPRTRADQGMGIFTARVNDSQTISTIEIPEDDSSPLVSDDDLPTSPDLELGYRHINGSRYKEAASPTGPTDLSLSPNNSQEDLALSTPPSISHSKSSVNRTSLTFFKEAKTKFIDAITPRSLVSI